MPEMYECYFQAPQPGMTVTVRSASDPRTLLPAIRRELGSWIAMYLSPRY